MHYSIWTWNTTNRLDWDVSPPREFNIMMNKKQVTKQYIQYDTVYVKCLQICKGCHMQFIDSWKNQESGHVEERAEGLRTAHCPCLLRHTQASGAKSLWLANNATIDNSKSEVSWPVSHINYLLLCYLVAKKHTKKHMLKQHNLEKSATRRSTGCKLHACNWLAQWFSKWGSWAGSINITREQEKNANSRPHPRPTESWTLRVGSSNRSFCQPLGCLRYLLLRRTTGLAGSVEKGSHPAEPSSTESLSVWLSSPLKMWTRSKWSLNSFQLYTLWPCTHL